MEMSVNRKTMKLDMGEADGDKNVKSKIRIINQVSEKVHGTKTICWPRVEGSKITKHHELPTKLYSRVVIPWCCWDYHSRNRLDFQGQETLPVNKMMSFFLMTNRNG